MLTCIYLYGLIIFCGDVLTSLWLLYRWTRCEDRGLWWKLVPEPSECAADLQGRRQPPCHHLPVETVSLKSKKKNNSGFRQTEHSSHCHESSLKQFQNQFFSVHVNMNVVSKDQNTRFYLFVKHVMEIRRTIGPRVCLTLTDMPDKRTHSVRFSAFGLFCFEAADAGRRVRTEKRLCYELLCSLEFVPDTRTWGGSCGLVWHTAGLTSVNFTSWQTHKLEESLYVVEASRKEFPLNNPWLDPLWVMTWNLVMWGWNG